MSDRLVSIIIPALNEEGTIAKVIDEIPREDIREKGYRIEIIVIDNNSTDRTREIAVEKGVRVIVERTRGKSRAIRTAFESIGGDFIIMLDADYTYPATYIPAILDVLADGYDVVLGSRLKGQMREGAMSKINLVGNHLLAWMASILYGTRISDLCTGYWGLTRRVIDSLKLDVDGFELEAAMFAEIAKKGYHLAEVPIYYRRRVTPAKLSSLKDGFKIVRTLLAKRFRR